VRGEKNTEYRRQNTEEYTFASRAFASIADFSLRCVPFNMTIKLEYTI